MTTQSIIVYRNPVEQMMWEGVMSGTFFPIIVGVVFFFAMFLTIDKFIVKKYFGWRSRGTLTAISLAVSAAAGIALIMYMA